MGWFNREPNPQVLRDIAEFRLNQIKAINSMLSTKSDGTYTVYATTQIDLAISRLEETAKDNTVSAKAAYVMAVNELKNAWKVRNEPAMKQQIGILMRMDSRILQPAA